MEHSRENIHIVTRLKPSILPIPISIQSNLITVPHSNTQKQFVFDQIFQPKTSQQQIYESIGFMLVERVVQGFYATIICYGQTCSGKTFTMYGEPNNHGIIPRAAKHLLDIRDSDQLKFILRVGCIEIYNEQIRDLLDLREKKYIKQSKQGVYVKDMMKKTIKSFDDFRDILNIVDSTRSTFSTSMNKQSSRSHCILTFYLQIMQEAGDTQIYKQGRLVCVDLAGSQRQKKTNSTGLRLKQANSINKNLVVLRSVIHSLIDKKDHIPYRDCKLTRLLKDSFGGGTKTTLVANISIDTQNVEETISTLRYAAIVSKVSNCPIIHYDAKDLLIMKYVDQIKKLKKQQESNAISNLNESFKDRLIHQKDEITHALELQQQTNQHLKNRIQELTRLINPNPELPISERKKINQYRKRKLKLLSEKQSVFEKSKQLILNTEIQIENQFQNQNLEFAQPQILRQKYELLKKRYLNLKDQIRLIQNDSKQQRQHLESRKDELEKDNIFLRSIVQRLFSNSEVAYLRSEAVLLPNKSFKIPEFSISNNRVQFSSRTNQLASNISDIQIKTLKDISQKNDNHQLKSGMIDEYFPGSRQKFRLRENEYSSKQKSGSKKKGFRPARSPHLRLKPSVSVTNFGVSQDSRSSSTQILNSIRSHKY